MKNSDSKNSLAELNPPEPICFICLEESSPDAPLIPSSLLRSCGCKFHTHADCWNEWRKGKTDNDCPYCGRRSLHLMIPMTAPFQQPYTAYHVNQQEEEHRFRCTYKKICVLLVFLAIVIGFLSGYFLES